MDDNNREKDDFELQYERQLKAFEALDGSSDDEDIFSAGSLSQDGAEQYNGSQTAYPETENTYGQNQTAPRKNARPQQGYAQSASKSSRPAASRSAPQKSSSSHGGSSNKKKKSSKNQRSSSQQHISREQPLQFGSRNDDRKRKKSGNKKVNNKMEEKRRSPVGTFFKALLIIILVLLILLQVLIFRYLGMVDYVDTGDRSYTNASMHSSDVMNVLVIGSDTRDEEVNGRTDSMILLSINKKTKQITMTSFMRDMYVEIPGNGWAKMNAAYVYGGAELLMDTIELNFDIQVDKYVYVDFFGFIDIVDAVGGIELDISDEEAEAMTSPMNEQNMYLGKDFGTDNLTSGGKNMKVNGNQALAYARTRYAGNADFERTERQRTVITKILEKATTLSPLKLDNFARTCLSNIRTNMTKSELYFLTYRVPFILKYDVEQLRIPEEGAYSYGDHDGQSTLDVDFDMCKKTLKDKIYG